MRLNVIIVGAGLGGLTAAACLIQRGHRVRVYEQSPRPGEIGAGIQISANAGRVLDSLGVLDTLAQMSVTPSCFRFRLFDTAETVYEVPLGDTHERLFGLPYLHVHRVDLHDALLNRLFELDADALVTGAKLTGVEQDESAATARFADGTRVTADLLIGADGIRSVVRSRTGAESPARFTGFCAWRVLVPAANAGVDTEDLACTVWLGNDAHNVVYYLRGGSLANFVGIIESDDWRHESWTVKDDWRNLSDVFAGWHADLRVVVDAMPRDECYRWALFDREPRRGWSSGRITLLGDAAHPTLPFMAQGAAMAIEDAAILGRVFDEAVDMPAALALYEDVRFDRTARIQRGSSELGSLYHREDARGLTDAFARHGLRSDGDGWLYAFDPLSAPLVAGSGAA